VIMYPERGGVRGCKQVHNRIPGYARVLSVMTYIFGRTAQSTSEWKCSPLAALGSSGGMRIEAFPSVVGKSERAASERCVPVCVPRTMRLQNIRSCCGLPEEQRAASSA